MWSTRRSGQFLWAGMVSGLVVSLLTLSATSAGAARAVVVKEPQYGFSFSLPASWKQVPLNGSDVSALLNQASHADPSLAHALTSEVAAGASKGMKVFAIGPVAGSSVPSVNVIVTSSAGAPTGSGFAQAAVAEAKIELTEVGATHITATVVNDHLGRAAQAAYELKLPSGNEFGYQYYALHKSHIDIVTITSSSSASSLSNARVIVGSWRW
jgi:hypothetical protein